MYGVCNSPQAKVAATPLLLHFTMAAINNYTSFDPVTFVPRDRWSTPKKYAALIKSKLLRWLFCFDDSCLEEVQFEAEIRDQIAQELCIARPGSGKTGIQLAAESIAAEGYTMLSDEETFCTNQPVRVVPRFAAACVTCLRAKFGRLQPTEANLLLIEREYLRVLRETSVRNADIVAHQQYVMNTFFNEDALDRTALVRARLPRWLREAFGAAAPMPTTAC